MKKILHLLVGLALGFALGSPVAQAIEGILAQRCTSPVLLNGAPVEIEAYTINGHNYVKLRDIAQLVDFGVFWNGESRTVSIDTALGYTPDGGETALAEQTEEPEKDVPNGISAPNDIGRADLEKAAAALGCWPVYEVQQSSTGELYLTAKYTSAYEKAAAHSRSFVDSLAGMSSADKVRQIAFYVCDRLTYEASKSPTPAAVLAFDEVQQGNCMSYANSVLMLCKMADIPCVLVHSRTHQWNQVYVDGIWWNMDATSIGTVAEQDRYLVKGLLSDGDLYGSDYALMDEEALTFAKAVFTL